MEEVSLEKKKMSPKTFMAMVIFIITVDWMACDIFLPAQPDILVYFHTNAATLNMALSGYFIVSAFSVLIGGPLSDKFGRKRLLLIGVGLFAVFSYGCALAPTVEFLILCRCCAAFGAGFITAVTMAMVKDYLADSLFQTATTVMQSVIVLGPVVSPFVGSFVLMFAGWRWVLATLGILGTLAFIFALLLPETLPSERRIHGNFVSSMKGLVTVARDRNFTILLAVISLFAVPFFGFVAVCSYVCINDFGMSYLEYSLFYGGICLISFTAPFVYLLMNRRLKSKTQLRICFVLFALTTLGMIFVGKISPLLLLLVFIPYTYAEGISRPLGMVLLLNQHDDTTGAASALTSFVTSVVGTVGTVVATLSWGNYLDGLTWIFVGCLLLAMFFWLLMRKLKIKL